MEFENPEYEYLIVLTACIIVFVVIEQWMKNR